MPVSPTPTAPRLDPRPLLEGLEEARQRTFALIRGLADAQLEEVHSELMSPLVWDLGHIAAFEDLWLVHRQLAEPMVRGDLAEVYDAFETPRAQRGDLPFLAPSEAREYLSAVRARVTASALERGVGDGWVHEMVIRHEHQHNETMLQTLNLARIDGHRPPHVPAPPGPGGHTGLEMIEVPAGRFEMGAADGPFAYDNERPRHVVDLPAFGIARTPITNATFLSFVEGGGYERRELWTDEAWRWKQEYDICRPLNWTGDGHEWRLGGMEALDPDKPVVHVSWFEADALARAHGARLPTEAEWEKAATWDRETGTTLRYPWGWEAPGPLLGNLDHLGLGTAPVGAFPAGVAPCGALGMMGDVWEWTAGEFGGYPGFVAHPYPEYSEVFFDSGYRPLRGGSWATRFRVVTPTFRNWDLPQRRQIFTGVRLASDA